MDHSDHELDAALGTILRLMDENGASATDPGKTLAAANATIQTSRAEGLTDQSLPHDVELLLIVGSWCGNRGVSMDHMRKVGELLKDGDPPQAPE